MKNLLILFCWVFSFQILAQVPEYSLFVSSKPYPVPQYGVCLNETVSYQFDGGSLQVFDTGIYDLGVSIPVIDIKRYHRVGLWISVIGIPACDYFCSKTYDFKLIKFQSKLIDKYRPIPFGSPGWLTDLDKSCDVTIRTNFVGSPDNPFHQSVILPKYTQPASETSRTLDQNLFIESKNLFSDTPVTIPTVKWQYSYGGGFFFKDFPDDIKNVFPLNTTIENILRNEPNVQGGKVLKIKYVFSLLGLPTVESPILNFDILNNSPALDPNVNPNPNPVNPSCSDKTDGSFIVTFDRELDDTVSERMNLVVYQFDGIGFDIIAGTDVLTKSDFNGRSFTWNANGLAPGTYKIGWQTKTGTDPFTNPDAYDESNPFNLIAPPALSVRGTPTLVQCFGGNDGTITVIPDGGIPPYQYSIDGSNWQTNTLFDELSKGIYTISVRDSKDCDATSNPINIDERFPTIPLVIGIPGSINSPTLINGNNGRITISVSGGSGSYTSYTWTRNGSPFTPSAASTNTSLVNLFEGVYSITVTDSNGCNSEIETFTLTDPEPIDISINMTPDTVDCSDTQVNLIASATGGFLNSGGDYTYLWDDGTTGASLTNVGIGTYQVTVTDDGGNSQNKTFNVNGPNPITVTLANKKELSCRDGNDAAIQLNIQGGTGDYVITWENIVDPNFSALGNELKNVGFGSYVYRVVDQNGCFTTNSSQPIEFINPPLFSIDLGEDPFFCEGQTVNISAAIQDPNASYSWTSDTGFTSTNPQINVDQQGTYTVTVTSGKGCIAQDTITVIENIKEINAQFLYASQVFTNEKFVVIDVTYPIPDQIQWVMPEEATIVTQDQDLIELYFDKPGEYEITMISKLGNCQDTFTQKILVLQKEITDEQNQDNQNQQLGNIREFSVYPNPSDGKFSAKVTLKEQKDISIKIFKLTNNTILTQKKQSGKKQYEIPFTLQVPSGVYALVLETPYGNHIRKVIVK
ncbi:T9SS type A sorting domain-containing protein [Aquimarina sp. Aq78]|uniref:T9SS type A sorting domain-containing protein n=4 Tax=Aquimarina sp. Aq78 TaxID=1191889 RepID=UPI0020C1E04D|nr:T9SS type A sorting domain-containing protein [Aquimarina sp. Aq78]